MSYAVPVGYGFDEDTGATVVVYNNGTSKTLLPVPSEGGFEPVGTKEISITENGTYVENVKDYVNAEISVDVPPSGVTLSALPYPVVIETTRSGSFAINRALYKPSTEIGFARANITSTSPLTTENMLTDGTHVFFNAASGSEITYNGNHATFVKSGFDFMLTIPDGFDGTIPFILS